MQKFGQGDVKTAISIFGEGGKGLMPRSARLGIPSQWMISRDYCSMLT